MEESTFVPYEAHLLPGERVTVLAPHPDDEVLGCGGSLALLAREGRTISVHILTGGEAQGEPALRAEESRKAVALLGVERVTFHDLPDRGLSSHAQDLTDLVTKIIRDETPSCLILPGPHEAHPDHRATAAAVCRLLHEARPHDDLYALLRDMRIAFMEISLPQKINHLVDITPVIDQKREAMACFTTQQDVRDYATKILGLNAYRSTTLDPPATHAEGFALTTLQEVQTRPLSLLFPDGFPLEEKAPDLTVSLIIRTRNRPATLKEALESVASSWERPGEVIVVNDGGEDVTPVLASFGDLNVIPVNTKERVGRGAAANLGIERATGEAVAFLDDDDLLFPEHFKILKDALASCAAGVVYTDAARVTIEVNGEGQRKESSRTLAFVREWDPDLLLYDNFIPFHTLLIRRSLIEQAGPIREDLDLFEDWEFLIRLSRLTPFEHLPRLTCLYRNFAGAGTLGEDPTRHPEFIQGRRAVLELTRSYRTTEVEERLVKRLGDTIDRLREKLHTFEGEVTYHRERHAADRREIERLGTRLGQVEHEKEVNEAAARGEIERLTARVADLEVAFGESERRRAEVEKEMATLSESLKSTYREIDRLNGVLQMIYASKTWKLHAFIQRLKGKG